MARSAPARCRRTAARRACSRPDAPAPGGFAAYSLTSLVQRNTTYAVSAWILHTGAANATGRLAAKVECTAATAPPGHNTFPWLQNNGAVAPNTWTQLSGNLVIPNCDIVDVAIYFEGTATGIDVYMDDVRVVPPNNNLVNDGGFETGIAGWASWNGSTLSASTAAEAQRRAEPACHRPAERQPVRGVQPHQPRGGRHHLRGQRLGFPHRRGERHGAAGRQGGMRHAATRFPWLQNNTAVLPNTWTQLRETWRFPPAAR